MKTTMIYYSTSNEIERAQRITMLEAELAFYKKMAQTLVFEGEKMMDALKAGDLVYFGSVKIMKQPDAA